MIATAELVVVVGVATAVAAGAASSSAASVVIKYSNSFAMAVGYYESF